jgi:Rne/Rng family ribonuclease
MTSIDEIVFSATPGESRLALFSGGVIRELIVDRGGVAAGDIILGRIKGVNRASGAAFVDIGEAELGVLAAAGRFNEGQALIVQVASAARPGKGAQLAHEVWLTGPLLAYAPDRGHRNPPVAAPPGLTDWVPPALDPGEAVVPRLAASAEQWEDALASLRRQWLDIAAAAKTATAPARLFAPTPLARALAENPRVARVTVAEIRSLPEANRLFAGATCQAGAFDRSGAAETLDQAVEARVALPGGGTLTIEETAAFTTIDVDGGGRAASEANLAAVSVIASQIRLRGLAGHILVDFIPTKKRLAKARLLNAFRQALSDDPTPTRVTGMTPLGLVEVVRDRRRPSLGETMLAERQSRLSAETIGLAGLRALLRAVETDPTWRPVLVAAPPVIAALRCRPAVLADAAERLGCPAILREKPGVEHYEIILEKP